MAGLSKGKPNSIDGYLAGLDPERRKALQTLRERILSIIPGAEECISYSMPAFRLHGKVVAGFLATKPGASYFPFSGTTLDNVASLLTGYSRTKSGLHFELDRVLPVGLLRQLIQARLAELGPVKSEKQRAPAKTTAKRAAPAKKTAKAAAPTKKAAKGAAPAKKTAKAAAPTKKAAKRAANGKKTPRARK